MSKRDRANPAPEPRRSHDADAMQGPLFVVAALAACLYLMRLAGVFGHPAEHAVGILCWATMLVCALMRLSWESQHGSFPQRYGGLFVLVIALGLGLGLLVEITVASNPEHAANLQSL